MELQKWLGAMKSEEEIWKSMRKRRGNQRFRGETGLFWDLFGLSRAQAALETVCGRSSRRVLQAQPEDLLLRDSLHSSPLLRAVQEPSAPWKTPRLALFSHVFHGFQSSSSHFEAFRRRF